MNKNFRVRLICSVGMFAVALIAMYAFNGVLFKVLVGVVATLAAIELFSFLKKPKTVKNVTLLIFEAVFLVGATLFLSHISTLAIWYVIGGVCGYDIFAYLGGHLFGGKLIKKHRPFPRISPHKTWEGTIFGLAVSFCLVAILLYVTGSTAYPYLFSGLFALVGDLYESYLKRQFKIKDSNELVMKNPVLNKFEFLVGGSNGHGGFLDRVDSIAFTTTMLLMIFAFVQVL